jgi:serine/threonine protein kinase
VHLFDVVENSKRLCLVMQYAEGGDLFDYVLKSGKLPQHEAWRIFRQLLDAVNHIHKHGFMHRDIKPENILCVSLLTSLLNVATVSDILIVVAAASSLDKDLNVVLGDFGLGGKWSSLSPTNATCGSLNYAAPEILGANYYIGPEVDLWSCGAVLYMMLTGSVPFSAEVRSTAVAM